MAQESSSTQTYGLLAEFPGPEALLTACARIRDEGFKSWDAHVPFPLHGLQKAMGLQRSWVSTFVLVMGLSGAALGMLMQWWVATQAYPLVISGKPLFSWPAFVPVMFECGVLGGASGAILGFLLLAGLPKHHHPLFNSEVMAKATDDGFLVSIEAVDPRYDAEKTAAFLKEIGASHVETVEA
jgi:hypothetical protein